MNKFIFSSLLFLISFSDAKAQDPEAPKVDSIRYKTYSLGCGWGYDIYVNGKMAIHQAFIPAIHGGKCFSEEKYAARTAKLVVKKIKKGEWPPSVSIKELRKLKVPEAKKKRERDQ